MGKKKGSIKSRIVDMFLAELGISRELVSDVVKMLDHVTITEVEGGVEINIGLKNVKIKIDTQASQENNWI